MIFIKLVLSEINIKTRINRYKGIVIKIYDLEKLNFKKIGYETPTAKQ
jgi:hypothetical protein